jgi:hypothetical protein
MVFWHMGAYAPFILKCMLHTFCNFKKLKRKIRTYIFTCYTLTKLFHKNPTCRVTCVKKTKFNAENKAFQEINFLFFTQNTKHIGSS